MTPETIDRYAIDRELGRGGMATVYLATDPRFDRQVAVKVLPRQFTHDPTFRARFEREAKTIAQLEHPAIVPVYDFGEDDEQPYLVMRYMTGGSLADRLEGGPVAIEDCIRILTRIGRGLDEAHKQGIIHRDLKPANILFDQRDDAFLADFGIAKLGEATAALTGSGIVGTPAYMSPEQAQGEGLTSQSDIYNLGVILYEMLAGVPPYEADTPMGIAMKHIVEPVPDITRQNADLPAGTQQVIEKAIAKQPGDRFATASDLSAALQTVLDGEQDESEFKATVIEEPLEPPPPTRRREDVEAEISAAVAAAPVDKPSSNSRRYLGCLLIAVALVAIIGLAVGGGAGVYFLGNSEDAAATPETSPTFDLSGTSTAEAERRATSEARDLPLTQTAEVQQEGTQVIDAIAEGLAEVQAGQRLAGPLTFELAHADTGFIVTERANIDARDFVTDFFFINPYDSFDGSWDVGIGFREIAPADELQLIITSSGLWSLEERFGGDDVPVIQNGELVNLDTTDGGSNHVQLIVKGDRGHFFLNGEYIAELDLSSRMISGDVLVGTGFYTGNLIVGESTGVRDFAVWPLGPDSPDF